MAFNTDLRTNDSFILLDDLTTHVLKHTRTSGSWLILVRLVFGMVWYYPVAQAALNFSLSPFSPLYTLALATGFSN
jgi:hypothetical protein